MSVDKVVFKKIDLDTGRGGELEWGNDQIDGIINAYKGNGYVTTSVDVVNIGHKVATVMLSLEKSEG